MEVDPQILVQALLDAGFERLTPPEQRAYARLSWPSAPGRRCASLVVPLDTSAPEYEVMMRATLLELATFERTGQDLYEAFYRRRMSTVLDVQRHERRTGVRDEYVPEAQATVYELAKDRNEGKEPDDLHLTYESEMWRLRRDEARLRRELSETDELRERLAGLLDGVANALKGEPAELIWHSWHDLPEVAAELMRKLEEREK